MKVLILGASGFIGSHVFSVIASKNYRWLAPTRDHLDLKDAIAVSKYLEKHQPDAIINCAWLERGYNILLTERLLATETYLVNIGSGVEKTLHNEKWRQYAEEKREITKDLKGQDVLNLRCFGVYGPRDSDPNRFIPSNMKRGLERKWIVVRNGGCFDYIHVETLAEIITAGMEKHLTGQFDAVPKERHTLPDLASLIQQATGSPGVRCSIEKNGYYVGDGTKLRKLLEGSVNYIPMAYGLASLTRYMLGVEKL